MAQSDENPDLSFMGDDFKGEDGAYDVEKFSTHFGELTTFKSDTEAATAAAEAARPKEASEYAWQTSEDYAFPEGFDPAANQLPVLNEAGEPVMNADGTPQTRDTTANDFLSADDPDLPALQEIMLKHGADPKLMGDLAGILITREIRETTEAGRIAAEEKAALGPDAQTRIDVATRSLEARLPAAQVKAVLDGITSADALRGLEAIIKTTTTPPAKDTNPGFDMDGASNQELIAEGMRRQLSS